MNWPLLWGGLVTYVKKSLAGLGALKGSPAKVKSITPTYSELDPAVILKNEVTLQWDSNESRDPTQPPAWTETSFFTVDSGRNIYSIVYDASTSTAQFSNYIVTFYDKSTTTFKIPVSSGSLKKIVVSVLPAAADADKNAIYLVPIAGKTGSYNQYIAVEDQTTHLWEWLSLGSTDIDLSEYQHKIDENITKEFPNYDSATKGTKPTAKNVVGAVNDYIKAVNATYDYTNNLVSNLTTHTKTDLVSAINEMGNLENLECWDPTTQTPATLVDAININHATYDVETKTTVDRTKYIKEQQVTKDNHDGSAKVNVGDPIHQNRVDVEKRSTPESSTDYVDYRTYDVKVANQLYDPDDTMQKIYGQVHIPQLKLKKDSPVIEDVSDTITTSSWTMVTTGEYTSDVTLTHVPVTTTVTPTVTLSPDCGGTKDLITTAGTKTATIHVTGATTAPTVGCTATIVYKGESESIAARYFLQIEGKDYSETLSGAMIEIGKDSFLNDAGVKVCTEEGKPLPELHVGD